MLRLRPQTRPIAALLAALGLLCGPSAGAAGADVPLQIASVSPAHEPGTGDDADGEGKGGEMTDQPTYLEAPAFPGDRVLDALRLQFESLFLPDADLGPGHGSLYRPELRGRLTIPLSERAVLRTYAHGGMARYGFRGSDSFFGDSLDLYRSRIGVQGAYQLNEPGTHWIFEKERWSLLANLYGAAEFEAGAFEEGLQAGGALALGFEIPGSLQLAAGVSVATGLHGGGVDVSPTGFGQWDITPAVTLRNRGLGLQLEYHWSPKLEVYTAGFRSSDRYALSNTLCSPPVCPGVTPVDLDDLTVLDRQWLTGAGFEWKLTEWLRVNTEAGVVAWRRLKVHSEDLGTILSYSGNPSAYVELRFEVRP